MVRRLKEDIRVTQGGFPQRRVERVVIDRLPPNAPELELSRLLDEYRTAREERHANTSSKAQAATGLLVVGLQQRLLSSVEAFARSLAVHRRTVERHWEQWQAECATPARAEAATGEQADPPPAAGEGRASKAARTPVSEAENLFITPPAADDERADQEGELVEAEEEAQIEAITEAAESAATPKSGADRAALWRCEQQLLDRMQAIVDKARHQPDAKTRRLIDWVRERLCPGLPPFGHQPAGPPPRAGTTAAS